MATADKTLCVSIASAFPCYILNTAELHLSGLNATASLPDMRKFRIIGVFFENNLHWQFGAEK
jgi:hypothetical protein